MAKVWLEPARTQETDPKAAADDLVKQLKTDNPKLFHFFASRERDQKALNQALRERLPKGTRLVGATTQGECDRDGFHGGSVVAGALCGDIEVGLGFSEGLGRTPAKAGSTAVKEAAEDLGGKISDLDPKKYFGLVIDDGYKFRKEEVLLGVLEKNQSLVLTGGGAADSEQDMEKASAEIHVDDRVAGDSVAVVLFKTDAPWAALRAHPYKPLGQTVTITKVDDERKRALEIDGKPAAERYSEICGVPKDQLEFGTPNGFGRISLALRVGREYFMRSPWKPLEDDSILFANLLDDDMELELMELEDMPEATRRFFEEEVPARVKNPQGALLYHCSGRMWMAQSLDLVGRLGESFKNAPPSAGMNCFFEVYCGFHINTTLTTLVFGSDE